MTIMLVIKKGINLQKTMENLSMKECLRGISKLRLWTVHPRYLDVKGLLALWRESLLAQKVLMGKTKGWRNHPQLDRFKEHPAPVSAIGFYLHHVYEEGKRRGYNFKKEKIYRKSLNVPVIKVSKEWVFLEFKQLKHKLKTRDPKKYKQLLKVKEIELNPIFSLC